MVECEPSDLYLGSPLCRTLTCITSENDNVKQRVTHQAVSAVNSSDSLACDEQVFYAAGSSVCGDINTAVLIVERRVNENRLFADVNAVACRTYASSQGCCSSMVPSPPMISIIGVSSHTALPAPVFTPFASGRAFTDDGRCGDVTGLKRMHEYLTVCGLRA